MQQPMGFKDSSTPIHVFLLQKAICGLKRAPNAWFQRFGKSLLHLEFLVIHVDSSLFVLRRRKGDIVIFLVYVDDIVTTRNNLQLLQNLISHLCTHFSLEDMDSLHFFLGIKIGGIYLSHAKYVKDILKISMMYYAREIHTTLSHRSDFHVATGPTIDAFNYQSIVGGLEYLTLTRPSHTHFVNQVCPFMQAPVTAH